ncbi:alpha/beta hydrolase family protein [Pseudokordiimonas caeni]|uniref:alpha/beta hydrolase family protein n=1 Tax=Pseudokordiimonas caeni TaxID=2997908 RepID=UPI00281267BD|nr:alpha/beta fold hydrolase [Pseudokordiimonas caeni]
MKSSHAVFGTFARSTILAAALAGLSQASAADAVPALIPVERFAELPSAQHFNLSPGGDYVAYVSPINGRQHVFMHPIGDTSPETLVVLPPIDQGRITADISWIDWANNETLLIAYRFTDRIRGEEFTRTDMFSLNRKKGSKFMSMARPSKREKDEGLTSSRAQFKDRVIDMLPDDPDHIMTTLDPEMNGKYEIRKVKVKNGQFSVISDGMHGIQQWMTDQNHEPRIGWGYDRTEFHIVYKDPDTDRLGDIQDSGMMASGEIELLAFTENPKVAYALHLQEDGNHTLVTYNIPMGQIVETLFAPEEGDVTGLKRDPETDAIIGYRYNDPDGGRVHYIDKQIAGLKASIDKLLPDGLNEITDIVRSQKMFLILHSSVRDPGSYYLLDLKSKQLAPITRIRNIDPAALTDIEVQKIAARDGLEFEVLVTKPADREAKNLPMVVFPHGGPHSRSSISFHYMAQFMANRGYVVLQPNFRGSTGYGDAFMEAGYNEWGRKMQEDVTDATRWAIEQGLADPKRICIAGGSYGGYAALMGAVTEPDLYACAISFNGVADIPRMIEADKGFIGGKFRVKKIIPEGMNKEDISPVHRAGEINAPILLIHAKDDPVVPFDHGRAMNSKLKSLHKSVEFVEMDSGDHFLESAEARLMTLNAMEAFLARHIGGVAAGR